MNDFKKLCKAAAIVEIILGLIAHMSVIYFSATIVIGILLLYTSSKSDEEILANKSKIVILSIAAFIFNPISGIIMIVANGKIKDYEKGVNSINSPPNQKIIIKKKVVDPEIKKIDILLKLGVGMVFVSGILFATTSWDFINDLSKAIALIVLGTLFLGLSRFSETKLKLYYTTYMYWILAMSFYLLTVVGMLYFGIIGDMLTYTGEKSNLAYAITFFTTAGLTLATYLKFSQKGLLYVIYTSVLLMYINLLMGLNISNIIIILVITILSLLLNIFSKSENSLFKFNTLVAFSTIPFLCSVMTDANNILYLITSIFIVINISYLSIIKKQEPLSFISLALSYFLIISSILNLNTDTNKECIILAIISTLYTMLLRFKGVKVSNNYEIINYIIYSFVSLVLSMMATSFVPVIICLIYLISNYLMKIEKDESKTSIQKISRVIEPFAIFMIIYYFYNFAKSSTTLTFSTICVFATLVYTLATLISKDKITQKIYNIASYTGIFIYFSSVQYGYDKLPSIAIILPCLYQFITSLKDKDKKIVHVFLYILVLYSIYSPLYILNIFEIDKIISAIIIIWIISLVIYLIREDHIKKISYFVLTLPIYNIIEALNTNETLSTIMTSILILYVTFLITKFLCNEEKSKDVIGIIGIVLATLITFDSNNLIIGLYIGIIGIITTIIGYYRRNSKGLFITGIVITIINIIYQLEDLWGQIPFWLYLLVGGLGIIFFVTYREVNKMNKK